MSLGSVLYPPATKALWLFLSMVYMSVKEETFFTFSVSLVQSCLRRLSVKGVDSVTAYWKAGCWGSKTGSRGHWAPERGVDNTGPEGRAGEGCGWDGDSRSGGIRGRSNYTDFPAYAWGKLLIRIRLGSRELLLCRSGRCFTSSVITWIPWGASVTTGFLHRLLYSRAAALFRLRFLPGSPDVGLPGFILNRWK